MMTGRLRKREIMPDEDSFKQVNKSAIDLKQLEQKSVKDKVNREIDRLYGQILTHNSRVDRNHWKRVKQRLYWLISLVFDYLWTILSNPFTTIEHISRWGRKWWAREAPEPDEGYFEENK